MTQNEREKLPPPALCRECEHLTEYIFSGEKRHECELRMPMHKLCPTFKAKARGKQP